MTDLYIIPQFANPQYYDVSFVNPEWVKQRDMEDWKIPEGGLFLEDVEAMGFESLNVELPEWPNCIYYNTKTRKGIIRNPPNTRQVLERAIIDSLQRLSVKELNNILSFIHAER